MRGYHCAISYSGPSRPMRSEPCSGTAKRKPIAIVDLARLAARAAPRGRRASRVSRTSATRARAVRHEIPNLVAAVETAHAPPRVLGKEIRARAPRPVEVLVELQPHEAQRIGRVVRVAERDVPLIVWRVGVERRRDGVVGALLPVLGARMSIRAAHPAGRRPIHAIQASERVRSRRHARSAVALPRLYDRNAQRLDAHGCHAWRCRLRRVRDRRACDQTCETRQHRKAHWIPDHEMRFDCNCDNLPMRTTRHSDRIIGARALLARATALPYPHYVSTTSPRTRGAMLAGHATADGTARYGARVAAKLASDFLRPLPPAVLVSSIGLGSYLGECDEADDIRYADTAHHAIATGINLLDSAINYRCQRSERAFGKALSRAVRMETASRDELVVCTKGGYIPLDGTQPANPRGIPGVREARVHRYRHHARGGHRRGGPLPRRAFLANQLARSRANLSVETIDLYYLHNPEQQLDAIDEAELASRIRAAFEMLEARCAAGEIGGYGCATWNGLRTPPGERGHLSLAMLVQCAREAAGGADHHFQAVQLPVNLALNEAVRTQTQRIDDRCAHVLEAASELGVSVIASATLLQAKLASKLPQQMREALPGLSTDAQRAIAFVRGLPVITQRTRWHAQRRTRAREPRRRARRALSHGSCGRDRVRASVLCAPAIDGSAPRSASASTPPPRAHAEGNSPVVRAGAHVEQRVAAPIHAHRELEKGIRETPPGAIDRELPPVRVPAQRERHAGGGDRRPERGIVREHDREHAARNAASVARNVRRGNTRPRAMPRRRIARAGDREPRTAVLDAGGSRSPAPCARARAVAAAPRSSPRTPRDFPR